MTTTRDFDVPHNSAATDRTEPVLVSRYRSPSEAAVAQSLLRASGIDNYLADENLVRANWLYASAVGGMRLFVNSRDVERAKDVLANGVADNTAEDADEFKTVELRCPECRSSEIVRRPVVLSAALIAIAGGGISAAAGFVEFAIIFVLIAVGYAAFGGSHVCSECDYRWSEGAPRVTPPPDIADLRREPHVKCRKCASDEVYRQTRQKLAGVFLLSAWWTILFLPMALISLFSQPQWFCRNCGDRW